MEDAGDYRSEDGFVARYEPTLEAYAGSLRRYEFSVIVAMRLVSVMEMTLDGVVDVIAVGNRSMTARRAVNMIDRMIFAFVTGCARVRISCANA